MTCSFLVTNKNTYKPLDNSLLRTLDYCAHQIDKDTYEVIKNRFDGQTGLISYKQHIQNLIKCLEKPK